MKDCLNKDGGKKPKKSQLKLESFWRLVAHSWRRTVVSSLLFLRWNIADSLTGKLGKNGLISMQPHITPLQGFLSTQNVRHLCKEKSAINTAIGGTLLEASTTMKGATLFKKSQHAEMTFDQALHNSAIHDKCHSVTVLALPRELKTIPSIPHNLHASFKSASHY